MWQRFTERARRMVNFAQEEARQRGENQVSTEHLLLGLLREEDHVASRILREMGIDLTVIRDEVNRRMTRGEGKPMAEMQLMPSAKRVIDLAYDEARQLSNNYIGTEHLLLGLIREGEGVAAGGNLLVGIEAGEPIRASEGVAGRILLDLGVNLETTRSAVQKLQEDATQKSGTAEGSTLAGNVLQKAKPLAKRVKEVYDFSVPEEGAAEPTPGRGDIGELGMGDGRKHLEFLPDAADIPAFVEVMTLKDEFAYRDLVTEGKVVLIPAGIEAKFLRQEMPNVCCIRILDGDHAGRIGFVPRQYLRNLHKDDRPFPPEIL